MRYVYPVVIAHDEDGEFVATSRDVPEAVTSGSSEAEALREIGDALGAALAGYVQEGRPVPPPSKAEHGERLAPVAPLVAAKLALLSAMREQGVTNAELARRMDVSEGAVRRLVNPDHASRLDGVVAALAALGHSLIIEDHTQDAA